MKNIKSIWQEGRYYDAWVLVHFLSGIVLGFGMLLLDIRTFAAYILAIFLFILWEIFEIIENIKEHKENRLGDIVIGIFGFILAFSVSPKFFDNFLIPFVVTSVIFAISSVVGWTRYFKYRN